MGLDLIYKSGDSVFTIRFSMADWQAIKQLRECLPRAVTTCFDVAEFGEPVLVSRMTLREAVDEIDALLAQRPELLPYTYQFKPEYMEIKGQRLVLSDRFQSGGQSGFRLPRDPEHC